MIKNILIGFLVLGLVALGGENLLAYEAQAVKDGGAIGGVVQFEGKASVPEKLQIARDKNVCGKTDKVDPSLIVHENKVVNAIVYIKNIGKGKKMEPLNVTLDQKGCEYHPHVLAFPTGSTIEVLNPDGILHNIHSYSHNNPVFNLAQPKFRKKLTVKIEKPELINVKCDVHAWMDGWLFSAANPYFSVTDDKGRFKLTDVPPGTYTVEVWHEKLGTHTTEVTVQPNKETHVNFELQKK